MKNFNWRGVLSLIVLMGVCHANLVLESTIVQARPMKVPMKAAEEVPNGGIVKNKPVGRASSKNIVQYANSSKNHTILVTTIKSAGLVGTLSSRGPYTVFAPTNNAFQKLPTNTVPTLLKAANKAKLVKLLTYHVVKGKYSAASIAQLIQKGKGIASLKTVYGEKLTFMKKGTSLIIKDAKGRTSKVTTANLNQSNGIIHVVDTVLMP